MPSISSAGIGSGLDVNSLVTQLVSAERSPVETQLNQLASRANTRISALGTFKSALSAFQDAAKALKDGGITKVSAQSADATVFGATAAAGSGSGSYDVEVVSLARAAKLVSADYADASAIVGSGTVTISVGGDSFDVVLTDGNNSLSALRSAINASADNTGVTASIVNDSNGAHLVLMGRNSGAAQAVSISSAAEIGGAPYVNVTTQQPAADAHIRVDGVSAYSATNTVTDVIEGVTLNLLKAKPGETFALTLAADAKSATEAVQKFVNSYNALAALGNSMTKYDAATQSGGVLLGDPAVRGIRQQLRNLLGAETAGTGSAYAHLSELGITAKTDGLLTLDTGKLNAALAGDALSVQKLFSAEGGYATRISSVLGEYLGSDGQIDAATQGQQARLKDIQQQRDRLDARMTAFEARTRAQFTALDSLITQLRGTQDFLTQQLNALSSFYTRES